MVVFEDLAVNVIHECMGREVGTYTDTSNDEVITEVENCDYSESVRKEPVVADDVTENTEQKVLEKIYQHEPMTIDIHPTAVSNRSADDVEIEIECHETNADVAVYVKNQGETYTVRYEERQ